MLLGAKVLSLHIKKTSGSGGTSEYARDETEQLPSGEVDDAGGLAAVPWSHRKVSVWATT